ncbi:MAG TPA: cupin domain-containing protein [Pyrinomonadaceae bacterium]|jgi:mannose-6-phosphate isomerase-like protein (cupin superfamily)|nr:cupin domain-containing protein [Pyrinomonadaceae bacterium]
MRKMLLMMLALPVVLSLSTVFAISPPPVTDDPGYVLERDAEVSKNEPGPHDGGGPSTGYVFFEKAPNLKFSFRKRVLHKGAGIGYHLQKTDEVYYFTGGQGVMTINGKPFAVQAGDAVLTRGGSSHGLMQKGAADLTIIITFQKE